MDEKEVLYFTCEPYKTCEYFENSIPSYGWPDLKFSFSSMFDHLLKFRLIQSDRKRKIKRIEVALFANKINVILPTTDELCWSVNMFSPPCDTEDGEKSGYFFSRFGSFARNDIGLPEIFIWFENGDFDSETDDRNITLEVQGLMFKNKEF